MEEETDDILSGFSDHLGSSPSMPRHIMVLIASPRVRDKAIGTFLGRIRGTTKQITMVKMIPKAIVNKAFKMVGIE